MIADVEELRAGEKAFVVEVRERRLNVEGMIAGEADQSWITWKPAVWSLYIGIKDTCWNRGGWWKGEMGFYSGR